jgi:hypothetical protein
MNLTLPVERVEYRYCSEDFRLNPGTANRRLGLDPIPWNEP